MKIVANTPVYILVSNFFDSEVGIQKHMIIAQTAEPPSFIYDIDINDRKGF